MTPGPIDGPAVRKHIPTRPLRPAAAGAGAGSATEDRGNAPSCGARPGEARRSDWRRSVRMRRRSARQHRRGFTLVEIMMVVMIIGFVLAIAVPNILKAREVSRVRACQKMLKSIYDA